MQSTNVHTVNWISELASVKYNQWFHPGPDHLLCSQADPFGGERWQESGEGEEMNGSW